VGSLLLGLIAGVLCFLASTKLKRALGYDDSLDVFGVHAVGGIVGAVLTGVFATSMDGLRTDLAMGSQLWIQTKSVLITIVFVAIASYVLLKIVDLIIGLRVSEEQETEGLDLALHDERGYNL
jgi:Amt family ammonium transporter